MKKLLIPISCIIIFGSCNYKLFVSKKSIVQNKNGYVLFLRSDIIFFEYNDTLDSKFLNSNHRNGFKIDGLLLNWMDSIAGKVKISIEMQQSKLDETISIIPVNIVYYLGDTWQKHSEKNLIRYRTEDGVGSLLYKLYDYRKILLITLLRKTDIKKIIPKE